MSTNAAIVDRYISHRLGLIGKENEIVREILAIMRRGEKQALGELADIYERAIRANGGQPLETWTPRGMKTQVRIIRNIEASLDGVLKPARAKLTDRLKDLAKDESAAWEKAVKASIPDPALDELQLFRVPTKQLEAMVRDQFGDRLTGAAADLADDLRQVSATAMRRVNLAIEDGIRDGDGMDAIVRRVSNNIGDESQFEHDLTAVVRQQVMRTSNDAIAMTMQENADVVKEWQFVATLDALTCPQCGPLDGMTFPLGEGPRPPLHPNCRCVNSPVVKSWQEMGLPESMPDAAKRFLDGKPAERVTWDDWVQKNPARMRKVLGPTRAQAIMDGKLSLKDLGDSWRTFNLDELGLEAA